MQSPLPIESATRPIYWHISHTWVMYVLLIIAVAISAYGFWRRVRVWRKLGRPASFSGLIIGRLMHLWRHVGLHARLRRERAAGLMHLAIMWSMVLLFIGTLVVMAEEDFGIPIMRGMFYLVFQKLTLNLAGAFLAVGLAVALVRRYVLRVPRLAQSRGGPANDPTDALSLFWPFLILLQGFALQAIRLAATQDPFAVWSPVGYALAIPISHLSEPTLIKAYQISWWFHLTTVLGWIAWLPYGKMIHIFLAPTNVLLGNIEARPRHPQPIDFENATQLGAARLTDFTWKDMLDLDACTACGRCEAACPAHASGAPLSPRNLILNIRDHMHAADGGASAADGLPLLAGNVIASETIWSCLTCGACVEECPVQVEHVPKIAEMRRFLTMEQSDVPETLQETLKSLEDRGHPYKAARHGRADWSKGLNLIQAGNGEEFDVLYWVGCTAAFDPRAQKVARSFVQLMHMAGMRVAILGDQESCCGDPARRAGHEYLYDMFARSNVDQLNEIAPQKIVTACPHCFNALGREYRDFGGEYSIMHHSQMLSNLINEGKLKVAAEVAKRITYHDPCYLGRYNREFDAPRDMIVSAGADLVEMELSRSKSFCCGGGGGHAFMTTGGSGPRVNQLRAEQASATGAEILATSCPFCLRMMEDGVSAIAGIDNMSVRDVAEILLEAIQDTAPRRDLGGVAQG